MGVRGLTSYCRQNQTKTSITEPDLHDVTLAVDFVGFLYHVCEEVYNESNASFSWLLLGGCTLRLERYVTSWIKRLHKRKIRLVFITDPPRCFGGENHRKGYCLEERASQKAEQIKQLAQSLEEGHATLATESVDNSKQNQTMKDSQLKFQQQQRMARTLLQTNGRFPFAREKLRSVLKKHGIGVKTASREADEELGNLVRSGKAFAVLAEDSDFLVMSGVRYIPFGNLTFYKSDENQDHLKIQARVFSSDMVAKSLGLEMEQLVDLALLCGNDFTPLLDNEFEMATILDFPVQRKKGKLYPVNAARWVVEHMPILHNPFLNMLESKRAGFLRALFEIYRFYGYDDLFLMKFPMKVEPSLSPKKLKMYKKLIDYYEYPPMAVDILETKACGLSHRFDVMAAIFGLEDKSQNVMLAPLRRLSYLVLDNPVVEEMIGGDCIEVHVAPLEFLRPFISIPIHRRMANEVGQMFSSLINVLLYQDPSGGTPKVTQFDSLLRKEDKMGIAVTNVVYALLIIWKQDCTFLKSANLVDDRFLELLLLSSLISLAVDCCKQKSSKWDRILFDEQLLNLQIYAIVGEYLEVLKQLHQLRLLLGCKVPLLSGCNTYFSGEVFIKVCHTLMHCDSQVKISQKKGTELSQNEVGLVTNSFAEVVDKNRFWSEYISIRSTMQRLKALVVLPVDVAYASLTSTSAATTALEKAMRSSRHQFVSNDGTLVVQHAAIAPLPPLPPALPLNRQTSALTPSCPPFQRNTSAPSFHASPHKGLVPSSLVKRLGSDSALRDSAGYFLEPETKTDKLLNLKGMMKTLPVYAHREDILKNVASNQLTIIQGETGCGKSTSVPQFLYDSWASGSTTSKRPVNIYVTQPRRIAAIELANTVARMREGNEFQEDGKIGNVVGYRIGQKQMTSSKTRITYVTTGYMVERIIHDPEALMKITHLVLDEVHERSLDVDLLLLLLKLQLKNHSHLRLVIMSATMDAQVLIKYLGKASSTSLINKKPLFVGSKLHPVKSVYLDELADYFPDLWRRRKKDIVSMRDQFLRISESRISAGSQIAKKAITKIHEKQIVLIEEMVRLLIDSQIHQSGSHSQCILIFVPGIGSINALYESLSLLATGAEGSDVQVLVLHSGIELENQQEAFKVLPGRSTKVILSTNIAESSVTIPDVTHVINCAIEKQIEIPNAESSHAEVLMESWCSRASVLQRAGRAGRVMPGVAFHLFTKAFQDYCMAEYNTPELLRKPLDRIILQLKGRLSDFGVPSVLLQQAMDAPDLSHIHGAYKLLAAYDAIDSTEEEGSQLTKFGSFVCHMPLSLDLCRLLMTGAYMIQDMNSEDRSWSLLLNTVILVAILSLPDIFMMPSFYHIKSAQTYVQEMKRNLQAKLQLDGGMWSEPLSIWLFYIQMMSKHRVNVKRNFNGVLHKLSISFRRYQTLNYLISDLCARLISLFNSKNGEFDKLFDANTILMLNKLDAYASSQRMDQELLNFARDTITSKRNVVCILRFLIIQNYGDQLIGCTRGKPSNIVDDDEDCDRVDLNLDKIEMAAFMSLSDRDKATLFNQLAGSDNPMDELAFLAYDQNVVSIYAYTTPKSQAESDINCFFDVAESTMQETSFPVALLYYIRGEKFPVDLSMRRNSEDGERVFKFRVAGSNLCNLSWKQQRDNVKASTGSRSLFSLPIRPLKTKKKKGTPEPILLAVYADRLFTGDETKMWCTNYTLLPPNSISYYPIMLLVTASRCANIHLFMDEEAGEILHVKVGAQDATFPRKMALKVEVLATINTVRAALSNALNWSVDSRKLCVTDLLALSNDSVFMTKTSTANEQQCKWQKLVINEPNKALLAEDRQMKSQKRI
ncbi:atp-dependent rna [Plasmopara halstedii]|uniref:Atp-dependent rna n=1 Tax=Plasmopara halstedii TaxID=4781 RepID=A0A0P1AXC1_PLAHL|nr:atp-dependent rna [Plasmopara halstedii]CEG45832.1 atp-dependent rna [Plasmopara halstedii]|eukprot:XP_024582201.1 atp-dependent rna [Plasmopara halstedii]